MSRGSDFGERLMEMLVQLVLRLHDERLYIGKKAISWGGIHSGTQRSYPMFNNPSNLTLV